MFRCYRRSHSTHVNLRDIEPSLAKSIAEGSTCPISLEPMEDINPAFRPLVAKSTPLRSCDTNSHGKSAAKFGNKTPHIVNLREFFSASFVLRVSFF